MSCNDRVLDTFSALYFFISKKTIFTEINIKTFQPPQDKLLCVALFIETFTIIAAIFRRDLLAVS